MNMAPDKLLAGGENQLGERAPVRMKVWVACGKAEPHPARVGRTWRWPA